MEVFFWFDLWEFPFTPLEFELGTPVTLILHSITVPWWHLIFTSIIFKYLTLVHYGMCLYYSGLTCERFFLTHPGFKWGTLDFSSCTLPLYHKDFWFLPGTISGILICCRGTGGDWTFESFFLPYWELNWEPMVRYFCILPLCNGYIWFSPMTISGIHSLLQSDLLWYCSDRTFESFL